MGINLKDLEREPIRKTYYYENQPIYVYNPTPIQKSKILNEILNEMNKKKMTLNSIMENGLILKDSTVLMMFYELTNIAMPEDEDEIEKILKDPNDILINIKMDIQQILSELINLTIKSQNIVEKMYKNLGLSNEQIAKILSKEENVTKLNDSIKKELNKNQKLKIKTKNKTKNRAKNKNKDKKNE